MLIDFIQQLLSMSDRPKSWLFASYCRALRAIIFCGAFPRLFNLTGPRLEQLSGRDKRNCSAAMADTPHAAYPGLKSMVRVLMGFAICNTPARGRSLQGVNNAFRLGFVS